MVTVNASGSPAVNISVSETNVVTVRIMSGVIGGGEGDGDMLAAVYDPQNIEADAFARANHTGEQSISTITEIDASSPENKDILQYDGEHYVNVINPNFLLVRNMTGSTIEAGKIVEIVGTTGARPNIAIADNSTSENVAGILIADIETSSNGYIQLSGTVGNDFINTSGMTSGNVVYLGANGAYVDVKPETGHIIAVGKVGVVHPTQGSLLLDMPAEAIVYDDITGTPGVKNSVEIDTGDIQLVGDSASPGNNKVYGTDGSGTKGWKDDPAGGFDISDMAQTWNDSGTTFTAIKMNVTDTDSAADSRMIDLQLDSASQFRVLKGGHLSLRGGPIILPPDSDVIEISAGVGFPGRSLRFSVNNGTVAAQFKFNEFDWNRANFWSWRDNGTGLTRNELHFYDRSTDYAFGFRQSGGFHGPNPTTVRVYNTWTDASNYENGALKHSGGDFIIGTEAAGTGTRENVVLDGANRATYSETPADITAALVAHGIMEPS